MRSFRTACALLAAAGASWVAPANAATRLYMIAIGNNQPPSQDAAAGRLLYADDDAASMAELGAEFGAQVTVLSVLDGPSQRRFPAVARDAKSPSLVELRRVVDWHRDRFERDRRAGDDPVLFVFYSGHGSRGGERAPSLALLDGPLTPSVLYDEVLARLPARYIHLMVDACHAEAVVRPRDLDAPSVAVTTDEQSRVIAKTSLSRFPNVGAIVATANDAESHEWDALQQGVFTHELLSAMRGSADVNRDGKIEYSEVSAFLNSANRDVADARARLSVLVHAPPVNGHAAIADLALARDGARLEGSARANQSFWVEDERGVRLAALHPEAGFRFGLLLPPGRGLYLRDGTNEAEIHPAPREVMALEKVAWRARASRERGAVEASLRRGLFATAFGPTYYRGFVDAREEFLPVAFRASPAPFDVPLDAEPVQRPTAGWMWASFGTAAALTGVAATFSILAHDAQNDAEKADVERAASSARDRFVFDRAVAVSAGVGAAAALGFGLWRLGSHGASVGVDPKHASATLRIVW